MTDAIERINELNGGPPAEIIGPVDVDSLHLYGTAGRINWGTTLYNLRSLVSSTGSPEPIILAAEGGRLSLVTWIDPDWRLYAELTGNGPAGGTLRWESTMAGNDWAQGEVSRVGESDQWYFSTPATGPDGEFVVDLFSDGAQDPGAEWQLATLSFYLFR